jgi:hypothetical protein
MAIGSEQDPLPVQEANHYKMAIDWDAGGNPTYVGKADPGRPTSQKGWQIKQITFDADNNPTGVLWANGTSRFVHIWDNRVSYLYS